MTACDLVRAISIALAKHETTIVITRLAWSVRSLRQQLRTLRPDP
jgi:hypothetical protein